MIVRSIFFFLTIQRTPISTRSYTLLPDTTLFRSISGEIDRHENTSMPRRTGSGTAVLRNGRRRVLEHGALAGRVYRHPATAGFAGTRRPHDWPGQGRQRPSHSRHRPSRAAAVAPRPPGRPPSPPTALPHRHG